MVKKKDVSFTFASLIRLIIFIVIVFFIISFISDQKQNSYSNSDPTLFLNENQSNFLIIKAGEIGNSLYQSIPENSRKQLENFNQTPAAIFIQEKVSLVKEASAGFPQKQIKEIQKMIVKSIYENTLRNIDSP